jgi:hypothetical protein
VYDRTEQGLIQVNLGYLADEHQLALDIGPIEKDAHDRWVAPVSTPAGLPPNLSREQLEAQLQELAARLRSENEVDVLFVLPAGSDPTVGVG